MGTLAQNWGWAPIYKPRFPAPGIPRKCSGRLVAGFGAVRFCGRFARSGSPDLHTRRCPPAPRRPNADDSRRKGALMGKYRQNTAANGWWARRRAANLHQLGCARIRLQVLRGIPQLFSARVMKAESKTDSACPTFAAFSTLLARSGARHHARRARTHGGGWRSGEMPPSHSRSNSAWNFPASHTAGNGRD